MADPSKSFKNRNYLQSLRDWDMRRMKLIREFIKNPPEKAEVLLHLKELRECFLYWAALDLPQTEMGEKPSGKCARRILAVVKAGILHIETGESEVASEEIADLWLTCIAKDRDPNG